MPASSLPDSARPTSARQIAGAIQNALGFAGGGTCDVFHAGEPDTVVGGIAVTMTATMAVLQRAVELGANLVVTHEPTFFQDGPLQALEADPVYRAKRAYIDQNKLVVWRCHDAVHQKRDVIVRGMTRALKWRLYISRDDARVFDLPQTTLGELVKTVKQRLDIAAVRVTGDPALKVRRAALSVGCSGWARQRDLMRRDAVDALLVGEVREWETCEYARDSAHAPWPQGLIVLGHANSEEPGMAYFARRLRRILPHLPIQYVASGDPFWHA